MIASMSAVFTGANLEKIYIPLKKIYIQNRCKQLNGQTGPFLSAMECIMNRINIVGFASALLIIPLMCIVACTVSVDSADDDANVPEVESANKLEECTDALLGETAFVTEDDAYYTCIRGKWLKMEANNEPSSSSKEESSDSKGDSSSSEEKFSDSSDLKVEYGTLTDARDKRTYKTITIGTQTWMAENLNYADTAKTQSLKGNSWCYDDDDVNCDETGRLYTWAAAIDSVKLASDEENPQVCGYGVYCKLPAKVQGICPEGWRLPKTEDWKTLIAAVNGSGMKSANLKSTSGWSGDGNGTNNSGFSILPAGHRYSDGYFYNAGTEASFWEAEDSNSSQENSEASCMSFFVHFKDALFSLGNKNYGFSIRCIEDSED